MLTHIRRFQKGLLIVVTVVICIAFAWLYNDYDAGRASDNSAFRVYGRDVTLKEFQHIQNSLPVYRSLGLLDFALAMFGERRMDNDPFDYVLNVVILRQEAQALGISPTETEIADALANLPAVKFQPLINEDYIVENILGPVGYTKADLYDLMSDYVSWKQLTNLLAAGVQPTDSEIDLLYARSFATMEASLIPFELEAIEKEITLSDEEISTYHEENQEMLLSGEKRAADYVVLAEPELAEDATEEEKAEARFAFGNDVNRLFTDLVQEGADFHAITKAKELEVESVEAFSAEAPPEQFADEPAILQALFATSLTPERPVSDPVRNKDGKFLIFKLTEIVPPEPLTLEEARPRIEEALRATKVREQIDASVAAARAKLLENLDAGKSIEEAAEAAGVTLEPLAPFSLREPPAGLPTAASIAQTAADLEPGSLSPSAVPVPEGSALVYLKSKELVESEDEAVRKDTLRATQTYQQSRRIFTAWFDERRRAAGAQRPNRLGPTG